MEQHGNVRQRPGHGGVVVLAPRLQFSVLVSRSDANVLELVAVVERPAGNESADERQNGDDGVRRRIGQEVLLEVGLVDLGHEGGLLHGDRGQLPPSARGGDGAVDGGAHGSAKTHGGDDVCCLGRKLL